MTQEKSLVEIRWHGRGGQGTVTSAEMLALGAIAEGKYAQAFPNFGSERRGSPVQAFNRVDTREPIRLRVDITQPDYVVVNDPNLMGKVNVTSGLKDGGWVIINTSKTAQEIKSKFSIKNPVATVNATKIAREVLGVPIVSTTMLGAAIKVTGVIDKKSVHEALNKRFGRLGDRNIKAMETAFDQVVM
jgi:pyruvate ferredoxin oxidoreductase gamma subunit